jgi:hypothetical protein
VFLCQSKSKKYYKCIASLFFLIVSNFCYAQTLTKIELNEDDFLLLDIHLDGQLIVRSSDGYFSDKHQLFAIDQIFDALKIRYTISDSTLTIWKDDQATEFTLADDNTSGGGVWASDGFYFFVELELFKKIFDINTKFSSSELTLKIRTLGQFEFPIVKLRKLAIQRQFNKHLQINNTSKVLLPITIDDKYRLFTVPHGRVVISADVDSRSNSFIGSTQLTSDLLYHSANLTLSKNIDSDLSTNLTLSRYKTSPDELVLGAFDNYRLGDISGISNNLNSASSSGLGMSFHRKPANYRSSNSYIDIREIAPPGWEAELFRNQAYIDKQTVPLDGQLLFEEVPVNYGSNSFVIKLFGPFGEEKIVTRTVKLVKNGLSEGQIAYSVFALDKNHRMLETNDQDDYKLTDFGGTVDYGITDLWQLGLAYNYINSDMAFFNVKNAFSLPSFLIENNLSISDDLSYAQSTTVQGSIFVKDYYTLAFNSSDNFDSDKVSTQNRKQEDYSFSYTMPRNNFTNTFSIKYDSYDTRKILRASHGVSFNVWDVAMNHRLNYTQVKDEGNDFDNITGAIGLSGNIYDSLRLSGSISYDPEYEDIILPSSSFKLEQKIEGFWNETHYITGRVTPLGAKESSRWRLNYRVASYSNNMRFTFGSYYDDNDEWGVSLGLQFFLGYDYRNNRLMISESLSTGVATLDIHTYLDRHLNGEPDVLDYNISGVNFGGLNQWKNITSGENGRTILPGVAVNGAFPFSATWKDGATTINRDYTIYTHSGAYVDVNMPFFLSTDLTGFIVRQKSGVEAGIRNAEIQLLDKKLNVLQTRESDRDGYFEFLGLRPNTYTLRVSQRYLSNKDYTGEVIGYEVTTGGQGGFVELPVINLTRKAESDAKKSEDIVLFLMNESNSEAIIWDDDEKIRQNYFTLPTNKSISAKHSLTQSPEGNNLKEDKKSQKEKQSPNGNIFYKSIGKGVIENSSLLKIASLNKKVINIEGGLPTVRIRSLKEVNVAPSEAIIIKQELENSQAAVNINVAPSPEKIIDLPFPKVASNVAEIKPLNKTDNQWRIQFFAITAKLELSTIESQYLKIGKLFDATKVNANGVVFHCLISQSFATKKRALDKLAVMGVNGWVNQSKNYDYITAIN